MDEQNFIELKYASSDQQESLWILLLIFKLILDQEPIFIVFEEPEAHLYPEAQKDIVDLISLLANQNQNQIIITTHSPYILSAFNNLLYAEQVGQDYPQAEEIINRQFWLDIDRTAAYFIDQNRYELIIDPELHQIQAEKIDSASYQMNEIYNQLFNLG